MGTACFVLSFVSLLLFPWCASHLLGTGLSGGSLQRAATARTADGETNKMYAALSR